jgi:hypothetical protein
MSKEEGESELSEEGEVSGTGKDLGFDFFLHGFSVISLRREFLLPVIIYYCKQMFFLYEF